MRTDDSANYHSATYAGFKHNDIWNYGKEAWCNLEGRYLHIIADLSHIAEEDYNLNVCSVGIMGTQYVRDQSLPETLEI